MAWLVLIVSGAFEAVWAVALSKSEGFSRLIPSLIFVAALAVSMGGLAWALRSIPVGTGYTVWVGIGASAAVAYSMLSGQETASALKIVFLLMIVGGIIGLRLQS